MTSALRQFGSLLRERKAKRVLLAVSGGLDSMVMLQALAEVAPGWGVQLGVAHFNHHLRGRASDADERFVASAARQAGLPFFLGHGYFAGRSAKGRDSIEMAARGLRHAFLKEVANTEGFAWVATAHHADDQVELLLIRLARGAGGDGLSGMSRVGAMPNDPTLGLLRPLLGVGREEIERWAQVHGVRFREDATNRSVTILRNRIRHKVIPVLRRELGGDVMSNMLRSMEIVSAESECVQELAERWLARSSRSGWDRLPMAVQRQVIRMQLLDRSLDPGFAGVETLRQSLNLPVTLPGGRRVLRTKDGQINDCPEVASLSFLETSRKWVLEGRRGTVRFGGIRATWAIRSRWSAEWLRRPKPGVEVFDAAKVGTQLELRHWRSGDRFQKLGGSSASKVQDLFVNLKIPRERRSSLVFLAHHDGKLIWIEGLPVSESFKVDQSTRRCLVWRWSRSGHPSR